MYYSDFRGDGGSEIFEEILKANGYTKFDYQKDDIETMDKKLRYTFISGLESANERKVNKNTFNDIKNLIETRNPSSLVKDWVNKLQIKNSVEKVLENTDSIAVLTEWDEFKEIDLSKASKVFDGRNVVSNSKSQYTYSIGKIS